MIKVIKNENIITISGHAGSGEYGKDIVCASVSSIVYTTINAIKRLRESMITVEDDGQMVIKVNLNDEIVNALITNMLELLNDLANDYPKNLSVKEKKNVF